MLAGTNVLVVEEEFLIALDIQRMLEALGSGQIYCARSAQEARSQQQLWPSAGLAVIDVGLRPAAALELVPLLLSRNIPVVLCSADAALRYAGLAQFPDVPIIAKPMAEADLASAIGQVFSQPA